MPPMASVAPSKRTAAVCLLSEERMIREKNEPHHSIRDVTERKLHSWLYTLTHALQSLHRSFSLGISLRWKALPLRIPDLPEVGRMRLRIMILEYEGTNDGSGQAD